MGRILRKKPTTLRKKKRPEDASSVDAADPSADAARAVETADADAEAKRRPAPVVRKPQPTPVAAPSAPPADNVFTRSVQFLREVKIELKKVTWPSRQQTMGSTLVVIVLVSIISLFLGVVDLGLSSVVRALFK